MARLLSPLFASVRHLSPSFAVVHHPLSSFVFFRLLSPSFAIVRHRTPSFADHVNKMILMCISLKKISTRITSVHENHGLIAVRTRHDIIGVYFVSCGRISNMHSGNHTYLKSQNDFIWPANDGERWRKKALDGERCRTTAKVAKEANEGE